MATDRVLRDDAMIMKIVEKILRSDELLDKIGKVIGEKTAAILKCYEERITQLESSLCKAHQDIDSLEQYSRRCNLRIYGVPETANENTDAIITSLCKEKLGINVGAELIDCSHRLGKKENGTRPILVKFCGRNIKRSIFNNKRKFKGTKIVVREDLTKRKLALMKEVHKRCGVVWTNECTVFTKLGSKIYKILTYDDLNRLVPMK